MVHGKAAYVDLRFSGMLLSADWQSVTDVSGQPTGTTVKCPAVQEFT